MTLLEDLNRWITIMFRRKIFNLDVYTLLNQLSFSISCWNLFCYHLKSTSSVLDKEHLVEGTETHLIQCKLRRKNVSGRSRGTGDIDPTEFHSRKCRLMREWNVNWKGGPEHLYLITPEIPGFASLHLSLCLCLQTSLSASVWQANTLIHSYSKQAQLDSVFLTPIFHFPGE